MKHIFSFLGPACLGISLAFFAAAPTAQAQTPAENESDSGAALFLELVRMETDRAKKLQLLEQFTARYPKHEYTTGALGWMQTTYLRNEQFDKVIQTGERLLQLDRYDLNAATLCLRAAEGKKDASLVKQWTERVSVIEKRPAAENPAPAKTPRKVPAS